MYKTIRTDKCIYIKTTRTLGRGEGKNMYKSFLKRGDIRSELALFFLLCRVQLLPPLCVNLTIVCFQLPADVTLNKILKAVIALSEQILQVPIPWLGVLKHTHTETCQVRLQTSEDLCDQRCLY